jgi:hypothetical protein
VTGAGFRELMERLARAWSTQDTELALSCFHEETRVLRRFRCERRQDVAVAHRELPVSAIASANEGLRPLDDFLPAYELSERHRLAIEAATAA